MVSWKHCALDLVSSSSNMGNYSTAKHYEDLRSSNSNEMLIMNEVLLLIFTDPEEWTGTAGINISIPVMARVNGEYWFDAKMHDADMYFEFSGYVLDFPHSDVFYPPSDMWCENRQMNNDLPGVPEFFSYTSESLFFYELPVEVNGIHFLNILSTRQEYYDYLQKVSRIDYKPIDIDTFIGRDNNFYYIHGA